MISSKPRREGLSSTAKLLLFELQSIWQKNQKIFASNEYFARRLNRSVRQIKRLLAELASAKLISTKSRRLRICEGGMTIFYSVRQIILEIAPQDSVQPSSKTCHRGADCQPLGVSSFPERESRQRIGGGDVEHQMTNLQCPSCRDSDVPAHMGDIDVPHKGGDIKERNVFTNPPLPPIPLDETDLVNRRKRIREYFTGKGLSVDERELELGVKEPDEVIVLWAKYADDKRRGKDIRAPLGLARYRVSERNQRVDPYELQALANGKDKSDSRVQETPEKRRMNQLKIQKTQVAMQKLADDFQHRAHSAGD